MFRMISAYLIFFTLIGTAQSVTIPDKLDCGSQVYGFVQCNVNGVVVYYFADFFGLTGTIPTSLGTYTALQIIRLSNNALTGTIPSELGNIKGPLITLDLSENQLCGEAPAKLTSFCPLGQCLHVSVMDLCPPCQAKQGTKKYKRFCVSKTAAAKKLCSRKELIRDAVSKMM